MIPAGEQRGVKMESEKNKFPSVTPLTPINAPIDTSLCPHWAMAMQLNPACRDSARRTGVGALARARWGHGFPRQHRLDPFAPPSALTDHPADW